ncbi:MAG: transglycosylase SLT domain-containing protein [Nitrospirae bacterium]|nr:transglycosylase SLT domain-containing protein [Nitrospirota bacterium]MCL5978487.1 transglycosylase SLT domain-containing protein [Nitrospirota bacterium]
MFKLLTIIAFILISALPSFAAAANATDLQDADPPLRLLAEGKTSFNKLDNETAIEKLTAAYEKVPVLGDYILLWRARAYEAKGDIDKALADIKTIKDGYKDSPVIKSARTKEIELLQRKNDPSLLKIFEVFVRDYPSELGVKYAYAAYLKGNNETEKAKKIFKEIYISPSSMSKSALSELSHADITAEDLMKRGENLNKAWLFAEAEKSLREALHRSEGQLKNDILEKLAYSVFRQKRYKEAAELYKTLNNKYWRARSLLRTGDIETFESELPEFMKTGDRRFASLLIAYGTKKRRDGNIEKALEVFNNTLSKYPSEKEDILWAKGWTYYLSGEYRNASELFSQLYDTHGNSKYLYWKNRCSEKSESYNSPSSDTEAARNKKTVTHRDYYGFLSMLKDDAGLQPLSAMPETHSKGKTKNVKLDLLQPPRSLSPSLERVNILIRLGLKREAVSELVYISKKNTDPGNIVHLSSYLKDLGNHKMAVNLIAKIPYNENLHELLYPPAFSEEVDEASMKNNIDPLLVLSVMREESRFDTEARSIAGALGLMQLMPATAQRLDRHVKLNIKHPAQLHDAKTNILIGSYYLKQLLKTFNSAPAAIAAYNAGEDAVKEWLKKNTYSTIDEFIEDIPYDETRNYVKRVLTTYFEYMRAIKDTDISAVKKHIGAL